MENNIHQACRLAIEAKFKGGKHQFWTDSQYAELRDRIQVETKILISKNTLKRYFGKLDTPDAYNPQRETKNAFARYIGYQDWLSYEQALFPEMYEEKSIEPSNQQKDSEKGSIWKFFIGIPITMVLFILLGYFWFHSDAPPVWTFSIVNPKDTAPFTVFSRFRIQGQSIDTFSIQGIQRVKLNVSDSIHSTFISEPCYLFAEFHHNGKLLKMVPVHGLSRGWEVFYHHPTHKIKRRVNKAMTLSRSGLGTVPGWFKGKMLDSLNFNQEISNFKDFDLDGDAFTSEIETTIPGDNNLCQSLCVRFYGAERHLEYQIASPVCPSHNFVNLSEAFYSGNNTDFSNLRHPVNKKTVTRLKAKGKKCWLWVDGKMVYSGSYKLPVGKLKGIKIQFTGFGYINSIKAWNASGRLMEKNDFGNQK